MGVDVTVITCFPNFPKGKIFKGYKNRIYQKESINGITVIRVWSYITENNGFIRRVFDYLSYAFTSFVFGLFIKTDLIIATSPQFFTAMSGRALSFFKRKSWVMEVRDLWPDSIVAVGYMNQNSLAFKFLKRIEHHLYLSASKIIVVTESFKNRLKLEHGIESSKIGVFKNGVLASNFKNIDKNNVLALKKSLGIENKIIISYIGTHGVAHGLKFILDSIATLTDPKLYFLFIGDGEEKQSLLRYSKTLESENFIFLDGVKKEDVSLYLDLSDFSLINLKKSEEFKSVIPSKIFESVAMYKPILLGVGGEAKELIEDYQTGICFEPENTESLNKAIYAIQKLDLELFKDNCDKMLIDFDRDNIAEDLIKFILKH
jgi:glycosyltransferase involved in cell wall biosynthesis